MLISVKDAAVGLLDKVSRPPDTKLPPGATPEQVREFEQLQNITLPPELREWLEIINGARIGPGGVYGVHPAPADLRFDSHWDTYPEWRTRMWVPIAGDGNGNTYILDAISTGLSTHPVYFLDHESSMDAADYVVASDLWHFLFFLLKTDMEREQTRTSAWPFSRNYVLSLDPMLEQLSDIIPLPWEAT